MENSQYIMNTYSRFPVVLDHGQGARVWDGQGKAYLDFVAGIAVNSLGHNHPRLVSAIAAQAAKMIHVSNLYYTQPQMDLAERLVKLSGLGKAFFCNSGAEAIEGSLKLSRKYAVKQGSGRFEVVAMENSFHGRTFGALTATGQLKCHKGYAPLLPGFKHIPFNDIAALRAAVDHKTCAVLVEPVQGEGGVRPADKAFLQAARELCDQNGCLLIFDEVQCGAGRTGTFFAFEQFGVRPDVAALAKGLAGGVPIGCVLATEEAASAFQPGDHASTFGGNPLATAAANAVVEVITGGLLENVTANGAYLTQGLKALRAKHPVIREVRGLGFLQGIELDTPVAEVIDRCIGKGLLLVNAGTSVIRFVPPLIVGRAEIDEALAILDEAL